MTKPQFVYVTVIAKPPEEVWKALTSPEFTEKYWHSTKVKSDFLTGSIIEFYTESGVVGCEGQILTSRYPEELVYTWQFPNNTQTKDEQPSRVSFLLETVSKGTKLTLIHDEFQPDSHMYEMVSQGWPLVLAGLKTLLETGRAVDFSTE